MGAMSACIGMMNNGNSIKEVQYNFDSADDFPLQDKRKRYRLQQRSNSQIFVPIKKDEEFILSNSNEDNNKNKSDDKTINNDKIKDVEKIKNNSFIINNNYKKVKLRGKSNLCIKKKILNNTEDNCDIIECEDEFDYDKNNFNLINNNDLLSEKRFNYLSNQMQNAITNNIRTVKTNPIRQENGKENENDNENNNNGISNDSYNNKDLNMELSASKNKFSTNDVQRSTIFGNLINNEENGGKTLENENNKSKKEINKENKNEENKNKENKLFVIKDYYDGGLSDLKKHNDSLKIIKENNISITDKNDLKTKIAENYKYIDNVKKNIKFNSDSMKKNSSVKKTIKKNIDFNNCKIENNINFNIENNSNFNNNNNINSNNMNNINNNFNNISSINSDLNNNNFIDVSSNMTYFLSLEKSHRKPTSSRFDSKVLSLRKNHRPNSNASYSSKEISSNNYRNSVRVNKYKWKLLPKQKYNTQIYKSLINIPLSKEGQSLLLNEEEQKNLNMTLKYNNNDSSKVISEIKKQKEQQDKVIKNLENKIKNLEKKINEEKNKEEENNQKITKIEEYMDKNVIKKNNSEKIKENKLNNNINNMENILPEEQKDVKIKKLEEQLDIVKKNNKMNKNLLKKKDKQIKNLLHSKNKQLELIKQYEFLKNNNAKYNNFLHNYTTKTNKKISYLEDNSNSINNNNFNSNSNSNLTESKISVSDIRNNKNYLNSSINLKNIKYDFHEKEKLKKTHKKEKSITIQKNFFSNNSSKLAEDLALDNTENVKTRSSMREINRLKLNKNTNIKNINKSNLNNKSSSNISYYNYCNDLSNKSKNNYNTKITLNKMKMYKLNTSLNLTLNSDNKISRYLQPKKGNKNSLKDELNLDLNINSNTTKTTRKKFSFTKSKKLVKKSSEKNLKEMYLRAGTAKNDDNVNNNNSKSNISYVKSFSYNEILLLNHKNSFTNSNNNTTATNKINNDINLSLSPMLIPSNYPNKSNLENLNLEEKLNLSENINNIHIINPYIKSNSNEQMQDMNKLYQNLWNEGYMRYKQLIGNKKEEKNIKKINDGLLRLKFCMANEIFEMMVEKEELMVDIKNQFLEMFFEKKNYGINDKKYAYDNILFLDKDGIIDFNKKAKDINLENNELIVPVLKDVTS